MQTYHVQRSTFQLIQLAHKGLGRCVHQGGLALRLLLQLVEDCLVLHLLFVSDAYFTACADFWLPAFVQDAILSGNTGPLDSTKYKQLDELLNQTDMYTQFLMEQMDDESKEEAAVEPESEDSKAGSKRKAGKAGGKTAKRPKPTTATQVSGHIMHMLASACWQAWLLTVCQQFTCFCRSSDNIQHCGAAVPHQCCQHYRQHGYSLVSRQTYITTACSCISSCNANSCRHCEA